MANNQNPLSFINFNNNVSLSQNKWNDLRLHANKGCYYNNLLSPLWKHKENFKGKPLKVGNDSYSMYNGNLYKNGTLFKTNIPDGWTYDILDKEILGVFTVNSAVYRFCKKIINSAYAIILEINNTEYEISLPVDYAEIKIIKIPIKSGYRASFGCLTVNTDSPFRLTWRLVHVGNSGEIVIEEGQTLTTASTAFTEYHIIGGLIKDGSWAGFNIFSEIGWVTHNNVPVEILCSTSDVSQAKLLYINNYTVINETAHNVYESQVAIADANVDPNNNLTRYGNRYNYSVVENPKTPFYFCLNKKNGISIGGSYCPIYGFEMWVSSKSQLENSSLQLNNEITDVTYGNNTVTFKITSKELFIPHSCYNDFGAGFYAYNQTNIIYEATPGNFYTINWVNDILPGFQFNFASASLITDYYQENVYCGYQKVTDDAFFFAQDYLFPKSYYYFSIGFKNSSGSGEIAYKLNVNCEKTSFDLLNPGDKVWDPAKAICLYAPFNIAFSEDGIIDNILSYYGNALVQWNAVDNLRTDETNVIYGRFKNNNAWFKLHKSTASIVGLFNGKLLLNTDNQDGNAINLTTGDWDGCWTPGYNGALKGNYTSFVNPTALDITAASNTSMPATKVYAAAVNNHYEITQDYFTGSTFPIIIAYNYADYTVDNHFIYDIELYKKDSGIPEYTNSYRKLTSVSYINSDLSGQAYTFNENDILYSYFLANFSYKYYFNRFGVISLGNDITTNIRYLQQLYQLSVYSLSNLVDNIEYVFIVMGQIYFIINKMIFAVTLNANFSISYQLPVTECHNLIFCGNTSKYAIFWSPLTKEIFTFSGSQIFEKLQDASDISSIVAFENNYYLNVSLISYINSEGENKVLLLQDTRSSICFESNIDIEDNYDNATITQMQIESDRFYLITSNQDVYSIKFYQDDGFEKIKIDFETDTQFQDFSQNIIDCIYINAKKENGGTVKVILKSDGSENSKEFDLSKEKVSLTGLCLLRYQPEKQQRGRIAIKVESDVPIENIAYSATFIGNEISKTQIKI